MRKAEGTFGRLVVYSGLMSIKSKSSEVPEANSASVFPSFAPEIATLHAAAEPIGGAPPRSVTAQRMEQMYELADIFAAIFEALSDEHEHAIVVPPKAA